jgi:hypothetical protein
MKVTMDLDADLYRAVEVEAERSDRNVRDVVEAAIQTWLETAEEAEDRSTADAALEEYRRDGGTASEEFFG